MCGYKGRGYPASAFHPTTTSQCMTTGGQIDPDRCQLMVQARPSRPARKRKAGSRKTGCAIGRSSQT